MPNIKHKIESHFRETLGLEVKLGLWQPARRLPHFLRDEYKFYETEILGNHCLLMADKSEESNSGATIRKHIEAVKPKWKDDLIIYVRDQVTSVQRRWLIEQKIPFVVPDHQMYLPMLGIDLRENFRKVRQTRQTLSPATQVLILHILLDRKKSNFYTPGYLSECLGYSNMTMTRAFDDIEEGKLCEVTKKGRVRVLQLNATRQELWEKSLPMLSSPVKRDWYVRQQSEESIGVAAGLTALARYSMLAAPQTPVVAMTTSRWHQLERGKKLKHAVAGDTDAIEVQVWNYDPALFAEENTVDRLSLFLSLKDTDDERVEGALAEMMEGIEW